MSEVWWINQYAITPDLPGGTRHFDFAVELVRRGYNVRVFASDVNLALRKRTKLKPEELCKVEHHSGVDFIWIRSALYQKNDWRRAWNMLSFSANLLRVANQLSGFPSPDVVIGSSPHPFAALAAARLASKKKARFILELRDLWPQALVDMGGLSEKHPGVMAMRFVERLLYSRADAFITLAAGSATYLETKGIDRNRVFFVPNGVHLEHFRPALSRDASRKRYGFDRFTFVYAGAHGPANSLETIVEAARLVSDLPIDFVLVGDGPSKSGLRTIVETGGLANVEFKDPVSKDEIASLLGAADAAIITLRNAKAFEYGISPNKLFDYMAARLPILCAVPGEVASMVQEAGAGVVVEPEDPQKLAEGIRFLYVMGSDCRLEMGQRGFEYLKSRFDRAKLADDLSRALEATLSAGL